MLLLLCRLPAALCSSEQLCAFHASPSLVCCPEQVPPEILNDAALNAAIAILPANYNFEIHKTVSCGSVFGLGRADVHWLACVVAGHVTAEFWTHAAAEQHCCHA